ncbi:MAG: fatty acid desaturase [Deltaproteobacteria bacterium]|nr:fatty acid desaturase [Deltaproteobacteria bacterium]
MSEKTRPTVVKALPFWLQTSLIGFVLIHVASLALPFVVGVGLKSLALCFGLYVMRMWGITAGYHRYFAHRSYKTSRWFQFVLAWVGASSVQKGPLWWAGLHRMHHRWSDTPRDIHSPKQRGFWYSHVGWITAPDHDGTDLALIPDFAKYPELRWIDRFHWVPFAVLTALCFAIDGWRGVVWGAGVSTVFGWHGTFFINSLAHVWGSRRYETTDTSRNNPVLALITLGEGWHNNHHHYMNSANQGFFWWEVDVSYYTLRALALLGVVRDLRRPPAHVLRDKLVGAAELASAKFSGARASAELKLIEARTAVGQAVESAELRLTEARTAVGGERRAQAHRGAHRRRSGRQRSPHRDGQRGGERDPRRGDPAHRGARRGRERRRERGRRDGAREELIP